MLTGFLLVAAAVDAHPDQLVDTAWLAAHSKDANVRIVDVRRSGFDVGHIPGARWLDAGSVRDPGNTPSVLLSAAAFEHGIGASAAMFSLVNQILLHPRGVAEPGRILVVRTAYEHMNLSFDETSPHVFADMSAGRDVFEHVAAMRPASFNHRGADQPVRLQATAVSAEWFDVFGARPVLGRVSNGRRRARFGPGGGPGL